MDIQNSYRKIIEIMKNILEEIAARTRERIAKEKTCISVSELENRIQEVNKNAGKRITFLQALQKAIAKEYEQAGASAISCLTEPFYFQGADQYLREISAAVQIPVLRKDFTVDEYMIYQAKSLGASAVLLICAILDDGELRAYRQLAKELGLDALVEAHDEYEVDRALNLGAEIVGVNNRDLRTFQVDMNNSIRLRKMAPDNVVFVSESGIRTPEDIRLLYENKVDAVLIGETLMRSPDKKSALESLNSSPLR